MKYSLAPRQSSEFLKKFDPRTIEMMPAREAGLYRLPDLQPASPDDPEDKCIYLGDEPAQGYTEVEVDGVCIGLYFIAGESGVDERMLSHAREVLACIVELDSISREVAEGEEFDYDEDLRYVEFDEDQAALHYVANNANTEWSAFFVRTGEGEWSFDSIG